MELLTLDLETAREAALGMAGGGVVAILLVLKFVKSLVSKVLLVAAFGAIAWFGFTQREAITECAAHVQAAPGRPTECTFLGQTLTIPGLST